MVFSWGLNATGNPNNQAADDFLSAHGGSAKFDFIDLIGDNDTDEDGSLRTIRV